LAEASDPNTSSDRLQQMAENTGDILLTRVIACNPNININTIELVGEHLEELLSNSAFANSSGPYRERVEKLFSVHKSQIGKLRIEEISQWYEWILDHPEAAVRQAIAQNPYLPSRTHGAILTGSDDASKLGLALNVTTPAKTLKVLALDDSIKVQRLALSRLESETTSSVNEEDSLGSKSMKRMTKSKSLREKTREGEDESIRIHPMMLLVGIMLLLAAGMGIMLISPPSPPTNPSISDKGVAVNSGKSVAANESVVPEDASKTAYESALAIASKASLEGQIARSREDIRKVQELWTKAIAELKTVQPESPYYSKAQSKVDEYKSNKGLIGLKKIQKK
jgi:hypothetical protein